MGFPYGWLLVLSLVYVLSHQVPLSPDKKKLYHGITSGKGLYSPYDRVAVLNATDFKKTVFREVPRTSWIVEFYNSWCGHCLRFAPTWKSFAWDVSGWKKVVKVGAVDCSNSANTPLCREYDIMFYPAIKFFSVDAPETDLGIKVEQGPVEALRKSLITALGERSGAQVYSGASVAGMWEGVPQEVSYQLAVVQEPQSTTAAELALDLSAVSMVAVRDVPNSNTELLGSLGNKGLPKVFVVDRSPSAVHLEAAKTRSGVYSAAQTWLNTHGLTVPELPHRNETEAIISDVSEVAELMKLEERIKAKLHLEQLSDTVFQLDIERALKHSLLHEIPSKKIIDGEVMEALKEYLTVLSMYFPFGKQGMKYLKEIKEAIDNKSEISGTHFETLVRQAEEKNEPVYLSPSGWIGCRGSKPNLRGFPCGLWLTFHTLTVHALPSSSPSTRVLDGILGYVKHFFGCTDCSQHFQEMATTIQRKVKTGEDAVLWLWEAHNSANDRLKGDPQTEDPRHPKVQFPSRSTCADCYSPSGEFERPAVLYFLKSMYHNISYLLLDELPPPSTDSPSYLLRHEVMMEERFIYSDTSKPSIFNMFDVSLCVVLYVCCIGVILLVSVKFFLKRNYRRKVYVYDLFQKV